MTKAEFIQLLDAYKLSCYVVGYDTSQLDSLCDRYYHASNSDDKQDYKGAIGQTNTTIEHNRKISNEIRTKLINSFKGDEN